MKGARDAITRKEIFRLKSKSFSDHIDWYFWCWSGVKCNNVTDISHDPLSPPDKDGRSDSSNCSSIWTGSQNLKHPNALSIVRLETAVPSTVSTSKPQTRLTPSLHTTSGSAGCRMASSRMTTARRRRNSTMPALCSSRPMAAAAAGRQRRTFFCRALLSHNDHLRV